MKNRKIELILVLLVLAIQAAAFDYSYKDVNFKCKLNGNEVTITGFDRKAQEVVIPAKVQYNGNTYQVAEVSTFVNGDNYSARSLELEEGIRRIGRSAFVEFRQLRKVTLPASIQQIGRNAFRKNAGTVFILPATISEMALRNGDGIKVTEGTEATPATQPEELAMHTAPKAPAKVPSTATRQKTPTAPEPKTEPLADIDRNIPTTSRQNSNTFCVIIANEHYDDAPDVEYAIRDGEMMREYAEKTLGLPARNIKLYADATGGVIRRALGWMESIQEFNSDARFLLYYAGHGMPDELDKTAYIIPKDGWTKDLTHTCISLKEVYEKLGRMKARSVVVLLDACFSGMQRGKDMAVLPARGIAIKARREALSGHVVVLSAAAGDQTAMAYKEGRHGLFTYFLLSKLKQTKGNVTLGELFDYVEHEVKQESFFINDKMQTPTHSAAPAMQASWKDIKLY